MSYLLSVIIPTKDRYIYLKECLKTLVDIGSEKLEIIVQDNTVDNQEIVDYIRQLKYEHIKYYHCTENLSQTENSDLAVEKATGKYCCYIGDDDSLTEAVIGVCEYLDKNQIPACVCNVATYHWPDVVFEGKTKPALSFDSRKAKTKILDSRSVLKKVFSYGVQDIKYLARVYHGIIAKSVLEQVKALTGAYFPGPSPDMANAVASTMLVDRYLYVRLPLIVSGYSYKSAGGQGLRGAHKGSLKNAKQLPANAEAEWSRKIPKVWLGYTVWPESAEKAMIKMGREDCLEQINYAAMYAKIFLRYPEYRKMVLDSISGMKEKIKFIYECVRFMFRWVRERFHLFIRKRNGLQYVSFDAMSLTEACTIVNSHNKKGYDR